MPRLVVVSRYLKSGSGKNLSNYVKYIATREGAAVVKENNGTAPATKAQQELITSLLKDFSDSKSSFAYEEYRSSPTQKNASKFIEETIEHNSDIVANKKNYVGYLANRPGAVKFGSHGLFSQTDEPISLKKVAMEVAEHKGNVWTHVVSLRRDDAQKMGYDNLTAWRELIKRQIPNIAKQSKIDMANLKWYAAFHDKETNPHVHIVVYSTNEREGFLTEHGIEKIRSGFANDIYSDELHHLYEQQTNTRNMLKAESEKLIKQLAEEIENVYCSDTRLVELVKKLHSQLLVSKGKKVYGYLKKDVKKTVDDIFSRLAQNESIQKMYKLWCEMEQSKHDIYSSAKVDFPTMFDNPHFKSVKNMIVKAVSEIHFDFPVAETEIIPDDVEDDTDSSFPDEGDRPPPNTEESKGRIYIKWSDEYKAARRIINSKNPKEDDKKKAMQLLKSEAGKGNLLAFFDLGKLCDDDELSQDYYKKALSGFIKIEPSAKKLRPYIQYRIGKMFLYGLGMEKAPETAFKWLEQSAIAGNKFAQHSLANMFCYGEGTEKNLTKAVIWYSEAARQGMPYSDYALAQIYFYGNGTEQNEKTAQEHYKKALSGFLAYVADDQADDKLSYKIGRMYYSGLGTETDKRIGLKYLLNSAAKGNMQAKRIVGQELISGEYLSKDIDYGIELLTKCADNGDGSAAYKLGKTYFKEECVAADYDKAEKYLKTAADNGNEFAMYSLAKLYLSDEKYDLTKAIVLLEKAYENTQLQPFAAHSLAKILLEDNEIHDTARAIRLLESATDKNMWASYWLGKFYLFGMDGVASDRAQAYKWLHHSAENGNEYAQYLLDNAERYEDYMFTNAVIGMLVNLSRIISDDYDRENRKLRSQIDSKLRRVIDRKKQGLGIKPNNISM